MKKEKVKKEKVKKEKVTTEKVKKVKLTKEELGRQDAKKSVRAPGRKALLAFLDCEPVARRSPAAFAVASGGGITIATAAGWR